MDKGLVQVYTGDGKGKTTAAMGLALRALGNNLKVKVLQFFKSEMSGEITFLKKLGIEVELFNSQDKPTWTMNAEEEKTLISETLKGWQQLISHINNKQYDLIILDEMNHVLNRGYIASEEVLDVLNQQLQTELVFTGRNAPEWLIERADLVTEMKMHKHPYQQGIPSRIGIEK